MRIHRDGFTGRGVFVKCGDASDSRDSKVHLAERVDLKTHGKVDDRETERDQKPADRQQINRRERERKGQR